MIELMARKRNKLRLFGAVLGVVLVLAGYSTYVLLRPLPALIPTTTFHLSRAATQVNVNWPAYGESAIGAVGYGTLETHGANTPLPTASVIKVLTALVVLQKYPLQINQDGPTITLTQADVDSYNKYVAENGSVVRVSLGEQLTEYQALQALLLPSANNIAETLANWAFGSIDAYNAYANTYAKQLGMTSTIVTDPSGFLPTTVATPSDLVLLGEAALANPVIALITDTVAAGIPVQGAIHNVNFLLGHDRIIGIKTGNNDQDPGVFLVASQQTIDYQPVTIVGAIMNGPDLFTTMQDSLALIDSTTAGFVSVPVVAAGAAVATYSAPWQSPVSAIVNKAATLVVWSNSETKATVTLSALPQAASKGYKVGTVSVTNNTLKKQSTSSVVLKQTLTSPNIVWRLTHPFGG